MDLGAVRCDCLSNFYHGLPVSGWERMCRKCGNWDCFQNPLGFEDVPVEMTIQLMLCLGGFCLCTFCAFLAK